MTDKAKVAKVSEETQRNGREEIATIWGRIKKEIGNASFSYCDKLENGRSMKVYNWGMEEFFKAQRFFAEAGYTNTKIRTTPSCSGQYGDVGHNLRLWVQY